MSATTTESRLVERLRMVISDPTTREVRMFGGRSFMVNDEVVVSALRNGDLLVRVDRREHDALLSERGATPAEMGRGRIMGPGWINVSAAAITSSKQLSFWVRTALDRNRRTNGTSR